jgi:hypothetical protein
VQACVEFFTKRVVNQALTRHARKPLEGRSRASQGDSVFAHRDARRRARHVRRIDPSTQSEPAKIARVAALRCAKRAKDAFCALSIPCPLNLWRPYSSIQCPRRFHIVPSSSTSASRRPARAPRKLSPNRLIALRSCRDVKAPGSTARPKAATAPMSFGISARRTPLTITSAGTISTACPRPRRPTSKKEETGHRPTWTFRGGRGDRLAAAGRGKAPGRGLRSAWHVRRRSERGAGQITPPADQAPSLGA